MHRGQRRRNASTGRDITAFTRHRHHHPAFCLRPRTTEFRENVPRRNERSPRAQRSSLPGVGFYAAPSAVLQPQWQLEPSPTSTEDPEEGSPMITGADGASSKLAEVCKAHGSL